MTAPRFIRPGSTWLVTRRTTRRYFLLRPDPDNTTQNIYWYTTAVLAAKFGIQIHAVQVLSTHMHEVLTDVRGMLPAFLRERNRALANALKRHRDWAEEIFQRAPASCVEIYGVDALCREIGYTIANCVEAGLVDDPEDWPGARVVAADIGRRIVRVRRPDLYFRTENAAWPDRAELRIEMPDSLSATYGEEAPSVLRDAVRSAVALARQIARAGGRKVRLSIAALMALAVDRRATTADAAGERNPQFATAGQPELTRKAVLERSAFRLAYRSALRTAGDPTMRMLFPFGTWRWLRELHLATAPPPAPS